MLMVIQVTWQQAQAQFHWTLVLKGATRGLLDSERRTPNARRIWTHFLLAAAAADAVEWIILLFPCLVITLALTPSR